MIAANRWPGRAWAMAACVALLIAAAGCKDEQARQEADEQLANVRRERDDYLAQRDRAREDLKRAREALTEKYGNALTEAEQQREAIGLQLDQVRDAVNQAMAEDGRIAPLADADRSNVAKLTNELVARFRKLRAQVKELEADCQALTEARDSLTRSLQKQAGLPPATSRPDGAGSGP